MDKWISLVEKENGAVDVKEDPQYAARGLVSEVISWVIGTYDYVKDIITYKTASNYNVKIYYIRGSGEITKMVFEHK